MTDWTVSLVVEMEAVKVKKWIAIIGFLLILLVVGVIWLLPLFSSTLEVTSSSEDRMETVVTVAIAQTRNLERVLIFHGDLVARAQIHIIPRVPGRIETVHVQVGDKVNQGDILVQLEAEELILQKRQAGAALALAQANLDRTLAGARPEEVVQALAALEQAQASYDNMKQTHDRAALLYEQGVMSGNDWDGVKAQWTVAQAQLKTAQKSVELVQQGARAEDLAAARASVTQAQAAYDLASLTARHTKITAPISGLVSRVNADVGAMASAGAPVVTVVDSSLVRLHTQVGEGDVVRLQPGQPALIKLNALPNLGVQGIVATVAPAADASSGQFPITIDIPNEHGRLRPGMYGTAKIVIEHFEQVVSIPTRAIIQHQGAPHVYIVQSDVVHLTPVTVGENIQPYVEIIEGVSPGERIVVVGQENLRPNAQVRISRVEE